MEEHVIASPQRSHQESTSQACQDSKLEEEKNGINWQPARHQINGGIFLNFSQRETRMLGALKFLDFNFAKSQKIVGNNLENLKLRQFAGCPGGKCLRGKDVNGNNNGHDVLFYDPKSETNVSDEARSFSENNNNNLHWADKSCKSKRNDNSA